jgi:glycosyltransferase involved in cell wall biosynthesis
MKKRIGLFVAGSPHHGGKFQYNLNMLQAVAALPQEGYEVVVSFIEDHWAQYIDKHISGFRARRGFGDRAAFKIWHQSGLPVQWWRNLAPYFYPLAQQLLKQHCSLWIFPWEDTFAYQMPLPTLVAIHDLMHRYEPHFPEVARHYQRRERENRHICRWTRGVLVDSPVGKEQVEASYGLNPALMHVLPYVAPGYIFANLPGQTNLDKYALPPKFIFYPAQFWQHKNHQGLILAAAALKGRYPDIHLVFAGSRQNGYLPIHELVSQLGLQDRVHFLGYVPNADIPELYRRARAMMMPTFFGPTNIPPLEAHALGCPTAVSDIYAMRWQSGDAAIYFDPSTITEIAQAMEKLWTDDALCQELSRLGLARAAQWTQTHFNERLRNIIDKVLG